MGIIKYCYIGVELVLFVCWQHPFEINDMEWIVKPTYHSLLGEFRIMKVFPDDKFELVKVSDGSIHTELVKAKYLRRDPGIA